MYFGGFLLRRPGSWPLWLAFRSTVTSAAALIAVVALRSAALPKLTGQIDELELEVSQVTNWAIRMSDWLLVVPLPGLILGVAAIAVRSLRPVLAVLAAITSFLAMAAIVGTLVATLLPMYQMSRGMGVG